MSSARHLRLAVALVALAALPAGAAAQRTPPDSAARPDSARADSAAARDTTARDSVMSPLARAPRPASLAIGGDYAWDRDALFATGAVTLLDLLERVPGVTAYRSGWLVTPEIASYGGALGRIRIFYDGVELDPLHPRTGGAHDLSRVELWTLEEVAIERGAGELRVHLRSWRVQHTTPYTRTDVATGEYDTNLFRGFFGRRFRRGEVLQVGFQNYSTRDPQFGGDGDQLALFGRVGWASGPWSVDGMVQRSTRVQSAQLNRLDRADLPRLESGRQLAYVRAAYGDAATDGRWIQLMASTQSFDEESPFRAPALPEIPADSADTTRARAQYVAAAGWRRGALEVAATARLRAFDGERFFSPSARAGWTGPWLQAQLRAERSAEDSTLRADAELRLTPRAWLAATVGLGHAAHDESGRSAVTAARGELGLRVGRSWLVGGVTTRADDVSGAPVVFDRSFAPVALADVVGIYGGVRGPVWRDISAEVLATQWVDEGAGVYRPEQQARAQLTLDTRWLSRFPSGEFGFKASGVLEYRSGAVFPLEDASTLTTLRSTILNGVIEVRIQNGIAFLQARNILASQYELVPGFLMPRNVLVYGIRWQFWN